KGSAQAASESARQAFASSSDLTLQSNAAVPPEQEGRKRLANTYLIPRSSVIPDPEQPRQKFDEMSILELMASIKERGVKQPLTVRWNPTAQKYMVIDGGRRHEAATRLKLEELPCWVQQGDRKEVLIDQIVHNWQRVDLRPYETADALARLRDEFDLKQTDLCRVTGKPKSEISKLLALHDKVDPAVQDMARKDPANKLSKRHLYNISKIKPEKQIEVAKQVQQEGLTAQATERLINKDSHKLNVTKQPGIAARQRRFKTSNADVVMTFRRRSPTDRDVQDSLYEILRQMTE
ncbi:MAG: ParB/RepB/Spo0J family partition protein, partial [Planctomycetaceae bacterium]